MSKLTRVIVRKARRSDVAGVARALDQLLPGEASHQTRTSILARVLRDPRYDLLVAVGGGDLAGLVDLWTLPDPGEGSNVSTIQNLIVRREFRGQGISNLLVKEALRAAKKRRAHEIHVSTMMSNHRAISLYKKHGFNKRSLLLEKSPL